MNKSTLRDFAKFGAGLILGDFLVGCWFYFSGHLPLNFMGVNFNEQGIVAWMIFDVLLFAFLVNYGWYTSDSPKTTREKKFHNVAGILFTLVAILHLSRILFGFSFNLGSWNVPYWINGLGTVVTAFLAWVSFNLASK